MKKDIKILTILDKIQKERDPKDLNFQEQIIFQDENYTCFIPTQAQIEQWSMAMHNAMKFAYMPLIKDDRGIFLFICKKDQPNIPLNASFIWLDKEFTYSRKLCSNQILLNLANDHKIFNNFDLDGCYSKGEPLEALPKIYDLTTTSGKKLQTPKERKQLFEFYKGLIEQTGFNGNEWFKDFANAVAKPIPKKDKKVVKPTKELIR